MQLLLKTKFIIVVLVMLTSLSGCVKDLDLNPATTVMRTIIQMDNN
jgi:hypothetical protein